MFFNSGWLSYFSSFISLIGTLFLGSVTLWQTEKIKNDEFKERKANTERPYLSISRVLIASEPLLFCNNSYRGQIKISETITIELKNEGNGIATNFAYHPRYDWFGEMPEEENQQHSIAKGEIIAIKIRPHIEKDYNSLKETITFEYQNIVGFKYSQSLEFICEPLTVSDDETSISVNISPISSQKELSD